MSDRDTSTDIMASNWAEETSAWAKHAVLTRVLLNAKSDLKSLQMSAAFVKGRDDLVNLLLKTTNSLISRLDEFEKSLRPPGAGWHLAPNSKKGSWRRKRGNRWEYWNSDSHMAEISVSADRREKLTVKEVLEALGDQHDKNLWNIAEKTAEQLGLKIEHKHYNIGAWPYDDKSPGLEPSRTIIVKSAVPGKNLSKSQIDALGSVLGAAANQESILIAFPQKTHDTKIKITLSLPIPDGDPSTIGPLVAKNIKYGASVVLNDKNEKVAAVVVYAERGDEQYDSAKDVALALNVEYDSKFEKPCAHHFRDIEEYAKLAAKHDLTVQEEPGVTRR